MTAEPPTASSRKAASAARSGISRWTALKPSHKRCTPSASCVCDSHSRIKLRTRLLAVAGVKARCLASKSAVSSACAGCPARRAALSCSRMATMRRAVAGGKDCKSSRLPAASRSSSSQRAARSWAPSVKVWRSADGPLRAASSADCPWRCRRSRSCKAWADSATMMCATVRKETAWSSSSPASRSNASFSSAICAALRARKKRPAMNWLMDSSRAAWAARSFCCMRQRLAC